MIVEYHRTHFDHFLLFTGPGLLIEAHPTAALPTAIQSPALGPVPGLDRTHDQSAAPALVHALALIPVRLTPAVQGPVAVAIAPGLDHMATAAPDPVPPLSKVETVGQ